MINNKNDTLRQLYNLDYDNSPLKSGLIVWYNNLINKTINTDSKLKARIKREVEWQTKQG